MPAPKPIASNPALPSNAESGERSPIPKQPTSSTPPRTNRLALYLGQIQDYWFHGPQARFARDAGVTESTLSRIIRGTTNPRYRDICRIVALLEKKLGRKIDPREVYEP